MSTDAGVPPGSRTPSIYRELLRHSGVYGIGLLLSRFASLLLLPLYTSYLSPRDYGVIAILDLGTALLTQFASAGVPAAVLRESFTPRFQGKSDPLWWTGLLLTALLAAPIALLVWLSRAPLSDLMFGQGLTGGAHFVELASWSIVPQVISTYMQTYARASKRSTLFVTMSLSGLLVRIFLNVLFIAFLHRGIQGFLYSTLIASGLESLVYGIILFGRKRWQWIGDCIPELLRYGLPIMAASLASLAMHQMDRAILRAFDVDLAAIGRYALAYTIAQAGSTLVLEPFHAIWSPLMFDVDRMPERAHVFRRVFLSLVVAVFLVQAGLALASEPILRLVAPPEYYGAANLLPWLCLAFFFFPLHTMFRVPVMLHRRTDRVAWTAASAAGVNLLLNLALIPRYQILGACWASVGTYAAFSFIGHALYRRTENFEYPLRVLAWAILIGTCAFFAQRLILPTSSLGFQILSAITFWSLSGVILLRATGWSSPRRWAEFWREVRG